MVLAIGLPLWDWAHGRAITPAFAPFAGWGAAALGGAYACVRTYLISGEPPKPPKGGMRLAVVRHAKAVGRLEPSDAPRERAA